MPFSPSNISHLINKFYVISVISNPIRYKSRYKLYQNFKKHVEDSGAKLITAEIAFGDRPFEVTEAGNPSHLQLRSFDELWHKENLINLAVKRLPSDWEYVAWIDSDLVFTRPDWVEETVHQLQHYHVVQMFSHAFDLGPDFNIIEKHNGFVWSYFQNGHNPPKGAGLSEYGFWHPGYAWAARREAFDFLGGLMDTPILGAADHHMAMALIGEIHRTYPGNINKEYVKPLLIWQQRAMEHIKRDIGYVEGTIQHFFHGKKRDRKYQQRWSILINNKFDPDLDVKRDWQGLWQLSGNKPRLRDDLRAYFRGRNEDSIDL